MLSSVCICLSLCPVLAFQPNTHADPILIPSYTRMLHGSWVINWAAKTGIPKFLVKMNETTAAYPAWREARRNSSNGGKGEANGSNSSSSSSSNGKREDIGVHVEADGCVHVDDECDEKGNGVHGELL